jgi:hypothetical protein
MFVLRVIVRSPFGHTLVGIRESESRMRTLGYNVWLHKYLAFVISGAVAGFAGVLWASYNGFVSPSDLDLAVSIETLLMVALGGRGTLLGASVGAAVIVLLKNLVSVYTRWLLAWASSHLHHPLCARRHRGRSGSGASGRGFACSDRWPEERGRRGRWPSPHSEPDRRIQSFGG